MRIFSPLNSESLPLLQEIEIATFFQLPSFHIIGLPSPEVAEARERVRSAIEAAGLEFPRRRVILNLSPAKIKKRGTGIDLAMALRILFSEAQSEIHIGAWGELGLDGIVKPAGQITRSVLAAIEGNLSALLICEQELPLAIQALQLIRKASNITRPVPTLIPVRTLKEATELLREESKILNFRSDLLDLNLKFDIENTSTQQETESLLPLSPSLERLICISASGQHHIILLGPKGVGKSHALDWLTKITPPLTLQEQLTQRLLYELNLQSQTHHSHRRIGSLVRPAALYGGIRSGSLRAGEFSLAHGGLLIADELPEWSRDSRECLREPLERGKVTLTRAQENIELPARFILAANGNLCPCGGWPRWLPKPDTTSSSTSNLSFRIKYRECLCSDRVQKAYMARLSGPILDRIDLISIINSLPQSQSGKSSSSFRSLSEKVLLTREKLIKNWGKIPGQLTSQEVEAILKRNNSLLEKISIFSMESLRSRHKIVRIALTLAAWDDSEIPHESHFIEAYHFRPESIISE